MDKGISHFLGMAHSFWRLFHTITIKMLPIAALSESLECKQYLEIDTLQKYFIY